MFASAESDFLFPPSVIRVSFINPLSFLIAVHHFFLLSFFILSCQALSTSRQSIASNQHYYVVCSISPCDISRKPKSESASNERYLFLVYRFLFIFYFIFCRALICSIPYILDGDSNFIIIIIIINVVLKCLLYIPFFGLEEICKTKNAVSFNRTGWLKIFLLD